MAKVTRLTETRIGVYPGTFDPITRGHFDIIRRAAKVVDRLIVAVAATAGKDPLFDLATRTELVENDVATLDALLRDRIEVRWFDELLVDFVESSGAAVIIRGLRAISDFEYEFQMVGMNSQLKPEIETLFLMASGNHQFISSRLVKEIAGLGGDIGAFVSPLVAERVTQKIAGHRDTGAA